MIHKSRSMWKTTVDLNTLQDYKERRLLKSHSHATLPLTIWNYTSLVQCTPRLWDEVTSFCRGLIVDNETGKVVARSFPKFWNDGENKHQATPEYDVFEKLDGSLGIIFHYKGGWMVASRGSFVSQQAQHASELLFSSDPSVRKYCVDDVHPSICMVVEIIYPGNRIVVDYGDRDELVLLAAFRYSGEEVYPLVIPHSDIFLRCGFPIAHCYGSSTPLEQLRAMDEKNKEGFVVRFSNGQHMKIKFHNYKELHRLVSNLSVTTLFDAYRQQQQTLADVIDTTPDEFHAWTRETWESFEALHDLMYTQLCKDMDLIMDGNTHDQMTQRTFALSVANLHVTNKNELFVMRRAIMEGSTILQIRQFLHPRFCQRTTLDG